MEKKTLYLECYSGISGDMTVASLIDLGADVNQLKEGLDSLNVDGYKIEISRKAKNSIDACDFNVLLDEDNHDHDLEYLFGHEHKHDHDHTHEHDQHHDHDHDHIHDHDHHHDHDQYHDHDHTHDQNPMHFGHHEHRNLESINNIIEHSKITENAKEIAKKIFYIIAEAESKAHGKSLEEVHFHEVGAVDSIVDITAVAICLDNLNIGDVIISELYEGTGQITCQHGVLPIPVPAVVNISTKYGLPLHMTLVKGELVTPTGAAIAAAIRTKQTLPKNFKITKVGLGAGKRNYENTSFLRAMLIEETKTSTTSINSDKVWVIRGKY